MVKNMEENRPKVGVGLLLIKQGKILLGKRKNAHGEGEWAGAGGHLELLESFEEGVRRELAEGVGKDLKLGTYVSYVSLI